jgi:hypothetical protein
MAGGMLTKQAVNLSNKYINDVNDPTSGGPIVSVPAGGPSAQVNQTQPGDRIVLDDPTALALSDTKTGTLYGGVYEYVQVFATSTAAPQRGAIAFFRQSDLGVAYQITADAQPSAAVPSYIAGIFINALTKGNFGWIQVAGPASVLFDTLTSSAAGNWVTAKVSPVTASTADCGAVAGVVTLAALLGVAVGIPSSTVISTVMLTRGNFMGRI